jgi:hypothetical protein
MRIVEAIVIAVLILLAGLIVLYARREIISRGGGTIEMSMRLSTLVPGRGWAPGLGRFTADELRWYRVFSLAPRPGRSWSGTSWWWKRAAGPTVPSGWPCRTGGWS